MVVGGWRGSSTYKLHTEKPHGRDLSVQYIYWAIVLKDEPPLRLSL